MGLFDDADRALRDADADRGAETDTDAEDTDTDTDPHPRDRASKGGTGTLGGAFQTEAGGETITVRGSTVEVDGEEVTIDRPETKQPDDKSGNWLTASDAYGVPRGIEAAKQRQIVQTAAMQSIANAISDQLLGGDLAFIDDEDVFEDLSPAEEEAAGRLKTVLRDVLTGPHMGDEDLDDIVVACVEDMLGPGNAYIQYLRPESGDLPVAALSTLDPLTVRHNYDEHGYPEDPPYWQAIGAFSSTSTGTGVMDPTPLQDEDVAVLRYPKGNRSYRRYPVSAAWQVKEWLEILADSVTHHKRYYSDNEVPPGLMQVVNATDSTITDIQNQVEQAAGDPRDFPIVGGEAPANWVEMGGTAINLNVIEEQKWFYQMCLMSLGLNKAESGMVEDVNYSNGEVQADMVLKKVGQPFGKQFERAMLEAARQFPTFTELGEPFTPTLANSDPRAEAAKNERLRNEFEAGVITLRQFHRRRGDMDLADDPDQYTVTVNGETIDYGDHPWPVAKRLLSAAGATDPDAGGSGDEPAGSDEDDDDGGGVLGTEDFPNRGKRDTPESVPDEAYPLSSGEDCPGTTVTGPQGGEYCVPAPEGAQEEVEDLPDEYTEDDLETVTSAAESIAEQGGSYEEAVAIVEDNVDGLDTEARRSIRQRAYAHREADLEVNGQEVPASAVIKDAYGSGDSDLKEAAIDGLDTDTYEHPRLDDTHESQEDYGDWRDEREGSLLNSGTAELWGAAIDTHGNDKVPDDAAADPDTVGDPLPGAVGDDPVTAIGDNIQNTREVLGEMFGDSVPVTRGVSGDLAEQIKEAKESGEAVEIDHRALESWSTFPDHAEQFANEGGEGVMITTEIPIDEVWGASHTTPGLAEDENEIIVGHDGAQTYDPENIQVANDDGMIEVYDDMGGE